MVSKVNKLKAELKKELKKEQDLEWKTLISNYKKLGKYLVGKCLIKYFTRYSWSVIKIEKFNVNHNMSSGYYGQWDEARYLELTGKELGIHLNAHQYTFSTDGKVDVEEIIKGAAEVHLSGEAYSLGIPLAPNKRWANQWKKFIELGKLEDRTTILSIGENAYKNRDIEGARKQLSQFTTFLRVLEDDSIYKTLENHYWERVKLEHSLYEKFKDHEDNVNEKKLDLKKIFGEE